MENSSILIIDDDLDIREALKAILQDQNYQVETAADRIEGMQKIESLRPNLIILDVMMASSQDGFEMSRQIKHNPDLKDLPILMLTGVSEKTGLDFKSAAGDSEWLPVDAFIEKPVDPDLLIEKVAELLS